MLKLEQSLKKNKINEKTPKLKLSMILKIEILKKLQPEKLIKLPLLNQTTATYVFWRNKCLNYKLPEKKSINNFYEKIKETINITNIFLKGTFNKNTFLIKLSDVTKISINKSNIYLSSDSGKIINFNRNLKIIEKMNFHSRGVWALDSSIRYINNIEESILATGSIDRTVVIHLNNKRFVFKNHLFTIRDIKIYKEYIIAASRDHTISIYINTNSHYFLCHILKGHKDSVRCIDLDKEYLVSGSYDGTVKLWNYKKGILINTIMNHESKVYAVIIGKRYIISSDYEGTIKIYEKKIKKIIYEKQISNGVIPYLKLMYSYNNKRYQEEYLYTGSIDGSCYQIDLKTLNRYLITKSLDSIINICIYNNLLFLGTKRSVKIYNKENKLIRELLVYRNIIDLCVQDCCVVVFEEDGILKMTIFE